jgi:nitrous oxidase accessory protein NosD
MKIKKHIKSIMKNSFLGLAVLATALAAQAQSWTNRYGNVWSHAVASDDLGNIIVTGEMAGNTHAGNVPVTMKYSPSGVLLWATPDKLMV